MPRGRKPGSVAKSIDEQIAEISAQIEKETEHISELKRRKKQLENKKKEADLDEIHRAMTARGISAQELLEMIVAHNDKA